TKEVTLYRLVKFSVMLSEGARPSRNTPTLKKAVHCSGEFFPSAAPPDMELSDKTRWPDFHGCGSVGVFRLCRAVRCANCSAPLKMTPQRYLNPANSCRRCQFDSRSSVASLRNSSASPCSLKCRAKRPSVRAKLT